MLEIEYEQDHEDLMNCFIVFVLYLKDKEKLVNIFLKAKEVSFLICILKWLF